MAHYELIEKKRDSNKIFYYDLLRDDEILLKDIKYSQGIEFIYTNMREGDEFKEVYLDGKSSVLLSYDDILNSFGMKSFFDKKH
jgi:hypothetical protein